MIPIPYEVIRQHLNLRHVKDNIYEDTEGIRYYLNKFGFHTTVQYGSMIKNDFETELHEAKMTKLKYEDQLIQLKVERKELKLIRQQAIGEGKSKSIKRILRAKHIDADMKLELIKEIVL